MRGCLRPSPACPLRVLDRTPEGADTLTIVFDDSARLAGGFEAGQYLTLEVPIAGERGPVSFSIG